MRLMPIPTRAAALILIVIGASRCPASDVVFETDIEYANPDGQHLQLNLARPRTGQGPFPAVLCIHGGGFRAGDRKGYDGLCKKLAERGYVAVTVELPAGAEVPVPRRGPRRQGGRPLAPRQRREVPHRPRPHRRDRRLGGRAPRAVPRRDRRT